MALLKSGSTVGGNLIWHQGILPLFPSNDSLYYKDFLVFTKKNLPTNADVGLGNVTNDAQVKKAGDTMTGNLKINTSGNAILDLKSIRIRADTSDQLVLSTEKKAMYFRVNGNDSSTDQLSISPNGTITGTRVLITGVQHGDAGALTRKDYVDGKVAELTKQTTDLTNTKVNKAGDTMTGNLTAPIVLVSAGQNNSANALARKDYVDGRANEKVAKAGDTMTGLLVNNVGYSVPAAGGNNTNGMFKGNADGATWENCNVDIKSWYGIGFRSDLDAGERTVIINTRNGNLTSKGIVIAESRFESPQIRVDSVNRKDGSSFVPADGNIYLKFASGSHSSGFKTGFLLNQIKDFLDKKPTFKQDLGANRQLNDIKTAGYYFQSANSNATAALNYPEANAGSLEVYDAAGVIQVYRVYNSGRSYQRAFYGTAWTPWTRNFSYGDSALSIGYQGVSGLGNNSIAIGDNDTGFRQVGDGLLEVVANSQRIARFDTGQALFDKNAYAPTFAATGGSVYTRGDGNSHYWFSTANGSEKAVIYAGADKQIHYRSNGGLHVFENRIQAPATGNQPSYGMSGSASGGSGCVVKGLVESGGWGQWRDRASGLLVEMPLTDGAVNIWKAVMWGRDWPAGMDVYLPSSGPAMAKLHIQGADFDFSAAGDFTTPRDVNANNVYIRSDERLKNNFRKIENAIDKVEQLTGFIYDKKISLEAEDYTETEAGIIAQSLQKVLPEAVSEREGLINVSSAGVNALLINAINELSARLKKLEK